MSSLDMTDVDRIVAETDMIAFIDAAICTVGAFGFATSQETEQSQAMDTIMNCLEEVNIALRILIEGLNAGKND